jgi:Fic family protein
MKVEGFDSKRPIAPYIPFPTFANWLDEEFDTTTFDAYSAQLRETMDSSPPEALAGALASATKWAAVDTGAIEGLYSVERGFTFSVAVSAAAWEKIPELKGESVARAIDDQVRAYEYVLDAATERAAMTEYWIKELHRTICNSAKTYTVLTDVGPQERELKKGVYKSEPNSPFNFESNEVHSYAPVLDTIPEMGRLVSELNSEQFGAAHPLMQAAYAHYAFVCIHPFADGNGRVSRALASVYLYRSPGIPLVVFADQKNSYIDALEAADAGKPRKFVQFISDRVVDAIGLVQTAVRNASQPDIGQQVKDITSMLQGRGGLQHAEVDAVATRLIELFAASIERQLEKYNLQAPLKATLQRINTTQISSFGAYRPLPGTNLHVQLILTSAAPAAAQSMRLYGVVVARPDNAGADFIVSYGGSVVLEVFLRELVPVASGALIYRADMAAERELRELLSDVAAKAKQSLRSSGYTT